MSGQPNFSQVCLTDEQMMMHGTQLEYNLQRYFYPALAVFGILGNGLNLTVLLNRNMRSRSNTFLSVLAFADIIFLSLLFPNILANYQTFALNYFFRWFYFHTKVHLISLANWCSAVAIWCVIAVCADRLVGIRSPLYARANWSSWRLPAIIAGIVVLTGAVTFYQHFEYFCLIRSYCQETQLYSRCLPVNSKTWFGNRQNPFTESFQQVISMSFLIYVTLMIIFPIFVLAVLNVMLLCVLRQRHRDFSVLTKNDRRSNETQLQKTEHRVTLTVTFIVTMFTVTNGPSALVHLIRTTYHLEQQELYDVTMICSTLVICGKASNFILFCLGSKHFRIRLMRLTQNKVNKKIGSIPALQAGLRNIFVIAQFIRTRTFRKHSALREDSLAGTLLPESVSKAIHARRQSMPSQKSSTSQAPVLVGRQSRTQSTADQYSRLSMNPRDSLPVL